MTVVSPPQAQCRGENLSNSAPLTLYFTNEISKISHTTKYYQINHNSLSVLSESATVEGDIDLSPINAIQLKMCLWEPAGVRTSITMCDTFVMNINHWSTWSLQRAVGGHLQWTPLHWQTVNHHCLFTVLLKDIIIYNLAINDLPLCFPMYSLWLLVIIVLSGSLSCHRIVHVSGITDEPLCLVLDLLVLLTMELWKSCT